MKKTITAMAIFTVLSSSTVVANSLKYSTENNESLFSQKVENTYGERNIALVPNVANLSASQSFTISLDVNASTTSGGLLTKIHPKTGAGFKLSLNKENFLEFVMADSEGNKSIVVSDEQVLFNNEWQTISVHYDGSKSVQGISVNMAGQTLALITVKDDFKTDMVHFMPMIAGGDESYVALKGKIKNIAIEQNPLASATTELLSPVGPHEVVVGPRGFTGTRGLKGPTGSTGVLGPKGYTGPIGFSFPGYPGVPGVKGPRGVKGDRGIRPLCR